MSNTKFLAILPKKLELGNAILIRGTVFPGAEEFSINFANTTCKEPSNISYHFKWDLSQNLLIEDYKMDGEWIDYQEKSINSLDGPLKLTNYKNFNSNFTYNYNSSQNLNAEQLNRFTNNTNDILGDQFALEFRFISHDYKDTVFVYDDGHNNITYFQLNENFYLSDIESLQVWGDVQKINQISFIYD